MADAMEMETDEFVAAAPGAVEHAAEAQGAADHASEAQGAAAHAAEAQGAAAHAAVAQGAAAHAAVAQGAAAHAAEVPDAAPAASAAPRMRAVPRGRPVPARAAPVVPAPLAAWPSQGRRGRSRPDQRTLARTVLSALPEDGGWMHVDDLLAATCQSNVEVSHVFLCTMFLAQSGNVRILHHAPGEVNRTNAFSLQLITTDESLYLGAISIFDQQMH